MKFRSKPVRTRGDSRRRALYSLAPRLACLFRRVLLGAHFPSAPKSFRINTCKSLSKQTTLTLFRINTYEKHRGRGLLLLTRNLNAPFCHSSACPRLCRGLPTSHESPVTFPKVAALPPGCYDLVFHDPR